MKKLFKTSISNANRMCFFFLKKKKKKIYIYIYIKTYQVLREFIQNLFLIRSQAHIFPGKWKVLFIQKYPKSKSQKQSKLLFFLPEHQRNKHFNFFLFFSVIKWTLCVNKPGAEGYFWLSVSLARTVTGGDKPAVRFWRFDQRFVLLSLCLLLTNLYFFTEITPNTPTHPNSN